MTSTYFVLAFFIAFTQRSGAGAAASFFEGYPPFISQLPAELPVAAEVAHLESPSSLLHAPFPAPFLRSTPAFSQSFYSFFPYPLYPGFYPSQQELHNVAGTLEKEDELLTDVRLRFPARKYAAKKVVMSKN